MLSIGEQICDEQRVPVDDRDDRSGEVERELRRDEAELAQIQATLERLREIHHRLGQGRLESDDRAFLRALIQAEYDALEAPGSDARLA